MKSPQIHFLHVCENAFLSKDNKLNLIGIFDRISVRKFPVRYPKIAVALNMTVDKGTHPFEIRIVEKGKEKPVVEMKGEVNAEAEKNFNLLSDFVGMVFEHQREYSVVLFVDGDIVGAKSFSVGLIPEKSQ